MKRSTRILNIILVFAMILGCVSFGAAAETDHGAAISSAVESYYKYSDIYVEHGFFSEGEFPGMAFLFRHLYLRGKSILLNEYCITTKENGYNRYTYEIPADVFEGMVFEIFAETDAALSALRGGKGYMTDRDVPYYRIEQLDTIIESSEMYKIRYAGYREREDGLFEAWSYIVDTGYGDATGGYLTIPVKVYDFSNETHYGTGFCYVSAKILYAVKSVVVIGDEGARFCSFEKADVSDVPDDLTENNVPDKNVMHNAVMYTTEESFGAGVSVYEDSPAGGGILSRAKMVLNGVEKAVTAHKFTAIKGEDKVKPLVPVTVAFDIPDNFSTDVRVYRIFEEVVEENGITYNDWKYELVESVVDANARTVTAVIEDFDCIYAVGGEYDREMNLGDATSDGKINLGDASLMLKYIAKWESLEIDLVAADVNKDGRVNISDVSKILKYITTNWFIPTQR